MSGPLSDPMMKDFDALWRRATAHDAAQTEHVYRSLADHYAEPGRHYHTLSHISHCLAQVALATELLPTADSIKLALWFHDVIWHPGARRTFAAPRPVPGCRVTCWMTSNG